MILQVVTPEKTVYTSNVDMVVLPTEEGEMGVWPNHAPLLTLLAPGQGRAQAGSRLVRFQCEGGLASVSNDTISVLTASATVE